MKILHVITGLETGGAELMLVRLLLGLDRTQFEPMVVSLTENGPAGALLAAAGIPVRVLGMRRGVPDPRAVVRLARLIRTWSPDLVQTWLYHADLIGGLAAKLAGGGRIPVAWGVHLGNLDPKLNKRATLLTARACARLSHRLPDAIVCCAESARAAHVDLGYDAAKMVVIPNGFDLAQFRPDAAARTAVRATLGVAAETPLVGLIARFDPQKDHETFIRAAGILAQRVPDAQVVLCGAGVTPDQPDLAAWLDAAGIRDRAHLLGRRDDVAWLLRGLDVACSSSRGEAFPLAVGEAMASGVPCVVTDVGDSARLVGATGITVPPADAAALAAAVAELIRIGPERRTALGVAARDRIAAQFSLVRTVAAYADFYARLATAPSALAWKGAPR